MTWTNIEQNRTWRAMRRMRELAELVVTGKKPMQMFCSPPGLGKSETVLAIMARHGIKPHYSAPSTIHGFCQDLWRYKDDIYFLDDCDNLARDEKLANVAKMAWGPQRIVVVPNSLRIQRNEDWRLKGDDRYDPETPPPTFGLGGRHGMIWCSNKNFTDPVVVGREMRTDFAALVSRGLDPLWIPADPQSVLDYTIWMIVDGMLRRHPQLDHRGDRGGFKLVHQQEVLDFLCTHARRLKEISPRMAFKLAKARRDDPHYEEAWGEQLAEHALYPGLILPDEPPKLISPTMKKATHPVPPAIGSGDAPDADDGQKDGDPKAPKVSAAPTIASEPINQKGVFGHEETHQVDYPPSHENGTTETSTAPSAKLGAEGFESSDELKGVLPSDIRYTPRPLAKQIIDYFQPTGIVLDPARGDGSFFDQFPADCQAEWCEIREVDGRVSRDFFGWMVPVDWIITNGPWSARAHTKFQRWALEIADNVVLLVRGNMGISTYLRIRDAQETGHGLKEIVTLDWPEGWPQYGYVLTAMHWQRGHTGPVKHTDLSIRTGRQSAAWKMSGADIG